MRYRAPVGEMRFLLDRVLGAGRLAETGAVRRGDAGDGRGGARRGGAARRGRAGAAAGGPATSSRRGWRTAWCGRRRGSPRPSGRSRRAAGSGSPPSPEHGGMGLPVTVATCVGEMFAGANLALSLAPLLTQGQIEALEAHADAALKAVYLPRLVAGDWTGTMNLTEPQAGLGRRRGADAGRAARRRQLSRLPGRRSSSPGATTTWRRTSATWCWRGCRRRRRGPGASRSSWCRSGCRARDGRPGVANAVRVVSLEHKMGLHGSPTCVMEFDGAPRLAGRRAAPGAGGDVHDDEQRPARGRGRGARARPRRRIRRRSASPASGGRGGRRSARRRSSAMPTCGGCWRRWRRRWRRRGRSASTARCRSTWGARPARRTGRRGRRC